eukprot:COSAG04_NODE_379_length_15473_cov_3.329322_4_plen_89_part_00
MATLGRVEAGQFNVNSEPSPIHSPFARALCAVLANRSAPLLLLPLRDDIELRLPTPAAAGTGVLPSCGAPSAARPDALPRPQSQRRRP